MKHVPYSNSNVNNTNTNVSIVTNTPVHNALPVNTPPHLVYPPQHPTVNTSVNNTLPLTVHTVNTPVPHPSSPPPTSTTSSHHTSCTNTPSGLWCTTYSSLSPLRHPLPYSPLTPYTDSSRTLPASTPYSPHCLPPHHHVPPLARAPYVPPPYILC